MALQWWGGICLIPSIVVEVTYSNAFRPRDAQITETFRWFIQSASSPHTYSSGFRWASSLADTLPHSHGVTGMRLLTIKLLSSLQVLYSPSISTPFSMATSSSSVWSHLSHRTSASRSEPFSCWQCAILYYTFGISWWSHFILLVSPTWKNPGLYLSENTVPINTTYIKDCEGWWLPNGHSSVVRTLAPQARDSELHTGNYRPYHHHQNMFTYNWRYFSST